MATCWDCKQETEDYVLELRATSGDQWGVTRESVPVHADRHRCHRNQQETRAREDVQATAFALRMQEQRVVEAATRLREAQEILRRIEGNDE